MVVPINLRSSHVFSQWLRLIDGAYMLAINRHARLWQIQVSVNDHNCGIGISSTFDTVLRRASPANPAVTVTRGKMWGTMGRRKMRGKRRLARFLLSAHLCGLGTRHSYDCDRNKNDQNSDWFSKQNNNCSRAPRFFVYFFVVTAWIRREKASFHVLWRT